MGRTWTDLTALSHPSSPLLRKRVIGIPIINAHNAWLQYYLTLQGGVKDNLAKLVTVDLWSASHEHLPTYLAWHWEQQHKPSSIACFLASVRRFYRF
ncbi:MAG TPA: hypothetical protein ENK78_00840 [Thiothrix sp.]|nr:hypothetical protein [Thiothrix sp.]